MNRRGFLFDIPEFMMLVFAFASVALIGYLVVDNMNDSFQDTSAIPTEGKSFFQNLTDRWPVVFDSGIVLFFSLLILVLLGLSWVVASNGIAFFIVWFVGILFMAMGGFLANAWDDLTSSSSLSAAAQGFPYTNFLMSHYLTIMIAVNFLVIIIFFAKRQVDQ